MDDGLRMLSARDAAKLTGLSYTLCLEIVKAHGKKIHERWYIAKDKLREVLGCAEE